MTTDIQFTALGSLDPRQDVAFQTQDTQEGANTSVGVSVHGRLWGVIGHGDDQAGVKGGGQVGVLGFAQSFTEPFPLSSASNLETIVLASAGVYGVCSDLGPNLGPAGTAGTSSEFTGVAGSSHFGTGVYGQSGDNAPLSGDAGVVGTSDSKTGVAGISNNAPGVFGQSGATDKVAMTGTAAVVGWADAVTGIAGASNSAPGVFGQSGAPGPDHGIAAVVGTSDRNTGVAGVSNQAPGVFGQLGTRGPLGAAPESSALPATKRVSLGAPTRRVACLANRARPGPIWG